MLVPPTIPFLWILHSIADDVTYGLYDERHSCDEVCNKRMQQRCCSVKAYTMDSSLLTLPSVPCDRVSGNMRDSSWSVDPIHPLGWRVTWKGSPNTNQWPPDLAPCKHELDSGSQSAEACEWKGASLLSGLRKVRYGSTRQDVTAVTLKKDVSHDNLQKALSFPSWKGMKALSLFSYSRCPDLAQC